MSSYGVNPIQRGRRAFLTAGIGYVATTTKVYAVPSSVGSCKPGAKNCVRGEFKPPAGAKKNEIADQLEQVLSSYPEDGQSKVDKGGKRFVVNELKGKGYASMEVRR